MKKKKAAPKPKAKVKSLSAAPPASTELPMRILVECLCASHVASYVRSEFQDRGGIILVGPPGVLKTTFLEFVGRVYHDALAISDINVPTLNDLKDQIASGSIRTLVIPELLKLYERDPRTAANLEGTLRALVAEGFLKASFEDARINTLRARCSVLTAITPDFQIQRFRHWEKTGFSRRFLWPLIRMKNPHLLDHAVEEGKLVDFFGKVDRLPPLPLTGYIRDETTVLERKELRTWLKGHPGSGVHNLQLSLLVKMLGVLKWWYGNTGRTHREALHTLRVFARSFQPGGAELVL